LAVGSWQYRQIKQSKTSWQKAKGSWQKFTIRTNQPINQPINQKQVGKGQKAVGKNSR